VHKRPCTHQHAALARPRSRIEYFVFGLLAEMQGHEVQLYTILLDGALNRYPKVQVEHEDDMPSGGAFSNPNDKALVTALEDKMIEAYGTALVEVKCKAAGGGKADLSRKMLRPQHVGALFAAVERYKVADLDLHLNQLGAAGGALVAAALETNTTLTSLRCAQLGRPSNQGQGLAALLVGPTLPALALLILASPFAQPLRQQPRPRGWHGARPGPQEQHRPQDAGVCCPAIEPCAPADALRPHEHARSLHWPSSPFPSPFAQPRRQLPRPRGWHGDRRGPQEQHHPREAPVCCPAIEPTRRCALRPHEHAR
jgi:hypothetical protein